MTTEFHLVTTLNEKRRAAGRSLLAPCTQNYGYPRYSQFLATTVYRQFTAEARVQPVATSSSSSATHQVDIKMEHADDEPRIVGRPEVDESDGDAKTATPKPGELSIENTDRNEY